MAAWAPWSLASCAVFVLGSLIVGEVFPFSRFDMYATKIDHHAGAVPAFWSGDRLVNPEHYRDFVGIQPDALDHPPAPCSMEYAVRDGQRWIRSHAAPAGSPEGPSDFRAGFIVVEQAADGSISHRDVVVTRGTASAR